MNEHPPVRPEAALGPTLPRNWYLVARARDVAAGRVLSRSFAGVEVVVFRMREGGALVAVDGVCRHMGCHLRHAEVTAQGLRCALHHRVITPEGRLVGGMGGAQAVIRQPTFPVIERYGGVFVYLGAGEPPPLPVPSVAQSEGVETVYAGEHRFPLPWQPIVANGFDAEHLSAVHERALLSTPTFEATPEGGMRLAYHSRPNGKSLADRFTNWIAPNGVYGEISNFGGTLMLVDTAVGKRRNFLMLSFLPEPQGMTTVCGVVGMASGRWPLWTRVKLAIARLLFVAFLRKDLRVMDDLRWREPRSQGGVGDDFTRRLCDYFRSLNDAR